MSVLPVIIWPKGIMPLVAGSRYQHHCPSSIIQEDSVAIMISTAAPTSITILALMVTLALVLLAESSSFSTMKSRTSCLRAL